MHIDTRLIAGDFIRLFYEKEKKNEEKQNGNMLSRPVKISMESDEKIFFLQTRVVKSI